MDLQHAFAVPVCLAEKLGIVRATSNNVYVSLADIAKPMFATQTMS
jgi:hypothetical protein